MPKGVYKRKSPKPKDIRIYYIFYSIKTRCNNPKTLNFEIYGGRGIKCLWKSFKEFRDDMYESYVEHTEKFGKDTSIDRINNDGNYCKENCRWVTAKKQQRNRRNNHLIKHRGRTLCVAEWCEILNISHWLVYNRIRRGWPPIKALTTPIMYK